jgi:DNA-directed RNA polymerase specialized sigma24 family protein
MTMPIDSQRSVREALQDGELRSALVRYVRQRVPESDVEDVVQAALADALASPQPPQTAEEIRRWVYAITRHKVADHYRRSKHEPVPDPEAGSDAATESAPISTRDLLRWAEREMPEGGQNTLEWMLREGAGEKLEHIAADAALPAATMRQRVSRMRRFLRDRWAAELALGAALLLVAGGALWVWRVRVPDQSIVAEPSRTQGPLERARELRQSALGHCTASRWERCLAELDEAKRLDAAGDVSSDVQLARERASIALGRTAPAPEPTTPEPVPEEPKSEPPEAPAPKPSPTMEKQPTLTEPRNTSDDWSK